jgi:tRNA nucleotidyltransferase (CCA-adding enzyme)
VRYEQRFNFRIGTRTLELLQDALELLDRVTPARIRHELERILQEAAPEKALQRLAELGVLAHIHPDLKMTPWTATQFARLRAARAATDADPLLCQEPIEHLYWGLFMVPLSAEVHAALTDRLSLKGETQRLVNGLRGLQENSEALRDPHLPPSRAVEILDKAPPVAVALLRVAALDPQITDVLGRYLTEWRAVHATLNGDDLQALGVPRGPLYSKILTQLRAARLDGLIKTREEELALVQALLAE